MSWIQKLYETYENCKSIIGKVNSEKEVPLLPICHTTNKAQITIVIGPQGNFMRAGVVSKDDARTIIPCTESSGGRTSGEAPHPLCDKLQYVAGDYALYGGRESFFDNYKKELEKWCSSAHKHPKAIAVLEYIKKKRVIQDLINHKVLILGKNGKLLEKTDLEGESSDIFKVLKDQSESFVRWEVEITDDKCSRVWEDKTLWDSWIKYYTDIKQEKSLCYVTGNKLFKAEQHPAKLRNDADKAKIISSNDSSGFTFRGRFTEAGQACAVGFEITQKAHSALRWLVNRQGYRNGDQAIVAWATSGAQIPDPLSDIFAIIGGEELACDKPDVSQTAQNFAIKLKKMIAGYKKNQSDTSSIVVMGLDSATPGRMALTYYRELTGSEFLERLEHWHNSCTWIHNYRSVEVGDKGKKTERKYLYFTGAPAPKDIAEAAYGNKIDDKLRKATVNRILPCIVDGRPIPRDIVDSAVKRACSRTGMEEWEWNKTLSIACALFNKLHEKEGYNMALDPNRRTRDYLYGRLLAIADKLEGHALYKAKEKRDTNAARYMQQFAERPNRTWRQIELQLSPYVARLGGASFYKNLIDEVMCKFEPDDFKSDMPLSGEFLLGYHCQRAELSNRKDEDNEMSEQ